MKLEGGISAAGRIAAIVGAGIPVCAHIGVLPQTAALGSGFRRKSDRELLLADARLARKRLRRRCRLALLKRHSP